MHNPTQRTLLAGAVALALGGGAHAAAQLPEFSQLDADRSGFIEPFEGQRALSLQQFSGADMDRDMRLNQNEYGQLRQQLGMAQAQQPPSQPPSAPPQAQSGQQPPPQTQAQAAPRQQGKQAGAEISVQEKPSQVQVEQQPPQVTVQQQPPEVTIVQPEPKVSVQQPKPEVNIQQAQPQVDVQQQGKPQVTVKEGGQPDVKYRESQAATQEGQPAQSQTASAQGIDGKKVSDLSGMAVITANGEEIGEVDQIVTSNADNQLYAVVAGGGFFGIGEDRGAIPLDTLKLQEDKLVWDAAGGEDALKQQRYDEQNYTEVEQEEITVAELRQQSAGGAPQQLSFQQLDRDSSGAISREEAQQMPELQQQWAQADADGNDQLDQSEFSAFEAQMQPKQ